MDLKDFVDESKTLDCTQTKNWECVTNTHRSRMDRDDDLFIDGLRLKAPANPQHDGCSVLTCEEMRNVQGSMTRSLERWYRNRMVELDMMQLCHTDALRPKLHMFRETCFVSTSATLSALSTFSNRKRPIETHD